MKDVPLEWAAYVDRWYATSTLQPSVRGSVRANLARWAGGWPPNTRRSPTLVSGPAKPALPGSPRWNACRSATTSSGGSTLRPPVIRSARRPRRASSTRPTLFRDCQEWEWIPRRFNSSLVLQTPRSIRALLGPKPRVIADEVWAKLLWAGLNLELDHVRRQPPPLPDRAPARAHPGPAVQRPAQRRDRPPTRRLHPQAARRGSRQRRLPRSPRPGCDLPARCPHPQDRHGVHQARRSAARPGRRGLAGRPTRTTDNDRPEDRRTGRLPVHLPGPSCREDVHQRGDHPDAVRQGRYADRGRPRQHHQPPGPHHHRQPALQRERADDPCWSYRPGSDTARREPRNTTRRSPGHAAKAYNDAGYFSRNVRTVEVLLDRDAVASGAAAAGEPWQYYDLGHGWCTYTSFEQCPHRMACARCDFYTPKGSSKAQMHEST